MAEAPARGKNLMRAVTAAILLLPLAAAAQPTESVTVNASALVGVWKITRPTYVAKRGLFASFEFGPPVAGFCRIEQEKNGLTMHCLAGGSGTVNLEGANIHFAWGGMIARVVIDGPLTSGNTFTGHEAIKLAGITTEDPNPSSGQKLDLSSPQKGPADDVMHTAISDGQARIPHNADIKDTLNADLGSVQAIVWLGHQDQPAPPGKPFLKDFFAVYAIEFDHGERLCGLHQREDSALDAFRCA